MLNGDDSPRGREHTRTLDLQKNRRRSERVMLQVPVVVSARMPDGKGIHEEAQTVVVNAHGGLLDIATEISVGQKILLINLKTKMAEGCRVARAEKSWDGHYSVAFEFERPAPKFWPIAFPPSDWEPLEA
jgi:hypothetical protein